MRTGGRHPLYLTMKDRAHRPERVIFARRLVFLRTLAGLKQEQVATQLGYTPSTVANWERGLAMPRATDIVALCKALRCTPNALFDWGNT
jgi:transcriptional regulator with XRE-family HTH domain